MNILFSFEYWISHYSFYGSNIISFPTKQKLSHRTEWCVLFVAVLSIPMLVYIHGMHIIKTAPKSDLQSQQWFFYKGTKGQINVDQGHCCSNVAQDETLFASVNPLFIKYTPTYGKFSGHDSYGVRSSEFVSMPVAALMQGKRHWMMITIVHWQPFTWWCGELQF